MTKYILASTAALALVIAPVAAMAQGNGSSDPAGSSQQMKGPPNANGMQKNDSSDTKTGRSDSSAGSDNNGATAAKSTGAEKQ